VVEVYVGVDLATKAPNKEVPAKTNDSLGETLATELVEKSEYIPAPTGITPTQVSNSASEGLKIELSVGAVKVALNKTKSKSAFCWPLSTICNEVIVPDPPENLTAFAKVRSPPTASLIV
jgi:hypothetical protein